MSHWWARTEERDAIGPRDVAVALVVMIAVVGGSAGASLAQYQQPDIRPLDVVGYALVVLGALFLVVRRAYPLTTFALTLSTSLVYEAARFPGGPGPFPVAVAIYTVASRGARPRSVGLALLATILLVGVRATFVSRGLTSPLLVIFPIAAVAALFAGQMLASRAAARLESAVAADEADRRRERETQRRVDAERLRIARELHDVVAHNISMINVQATMGVHLMADRPDRAAEALSAIKTASKQTLRELRSILDVLRAPDETEPTIPAAGIADLHTLVTGIRYAGLPAQLVIEGTPRFVPAPVQAAAYRIVQESLTNALRYAGHADTRIRLAYQPTSLQIEILDSGPGRPVPEPNDGHGITGMRERAAALGGRLSAGSNEGGGFAVLADLPLGPAEE